MIRTPPTWNGSFKAAAERLMLHKNTVHCRVRKAQEGLGSSLGDNRLHVELAVLASHWLGPRSCGSMKSLGHDGRPRCPYRGDFVTPDR